MDRKATVSKLIRDNMPWLILLIVSIVFSFFSNNFFSWTNIINILNQNAYIIVCSIGITFIMMSGQIDLSVGYQMSLIGVVCAKLMMTYDLPAGLVILMAIVMGVALSELNTLIAIKLNISMLMVTVATSMLFQGLSYTYSASKTVSNFSAAFKFISKGSLGPFPFAVILSLALVIIMNYFLVHTYWGRYIYALGSNEDAARLAGINVNRVKYLIGGLAGAFVGLSSMMLIARVGTAQSSIGVGTEFTVITGILLGGVSVRGGEGKLTGVMAGILIMAILGNGMQLAGFGVYVQYIIKGVIMVLAIGIDVYQLNHRKIVVEEIPDPGAETSDKPGN